MFSGSDKTVTTLKLVLRLYVAFMEKGLSADEVAFFKRFLIGSHASEMDVPEHRLAARVSAEIAGLPADFVDTYPERINALTRRRRQRRHQAPRARPRSGDHDGRDRAVMKKLLVDAKVQESAIDVVPYDELLRWREHETNKTEPRGARARRRDATSRSSTTTAGSTSRGPASPASSSSSRSPTTSGSCSSSSTAPPCTSG